MANAKVPTKIATSGSQSGVHTVHFGGAVLTSGVKGSLSNTAPTAGYVGESITNTGTAPGGLQDTTAEDCASQSFTAGSWLMWCGAEIGTLTGNTSNSQVLVSLSATADTLNNAAGASTNITIDSTGDVANVSSVQISTPVNVVRLSSAQTYHCVGRATFTSGTVTCAGFITGVRIN